MLVYKYEYAYEFAYEFNKLVLFTYVRTPFSTVRLFASVTPSGSNQVRVIFVGFSGFRHIVCERSVGNGFQLYLTTRGQDG